MDAVTILRLLVPIYERAERVASAIPPSDAELKHEARNLHAELRALHNIIARQTTKGGRP